MKLEKSTIGYFVGGCITGLILLMQCIASLPDGKLHIVFCDVGQGDAAYVRFPDGRDLLVDGGPNNKVLGCLGRHMPFWDRTLDMVVLSHPEKDHMQGLLSVLERYSVTYFVHTERAGSSDEYAKLMDIMRERKVTEKMVETGEIVRIGQVRLAVVGPSTDILGAATDVNDTSVVFELRYGSFDALFPGDATLTSLLSLNDIEVLKVPHHGSKTGMRADVINALKPELAVISVGKNSYGHPTKEVLDMLALIGSRVLRTDNEGDIHIVADQRGWEVE